MLTYFHEQIAGSGDEFPANLGCSTWILLFNDSSTIYIGFRIELFKSPLLYIQPNDFLRAKQPEIRQAPSPLASPLALILGNLKVPSGIGVGFITIVPSSLPRPI